MSGSLVFGSPIDDLLERLYAQHLAQDDVVSAYFMARAAEGSLDWNKFDDRTNEFLSDKFIALDRSKAEFCYQICRALGARRIVEAGTSFGVSTLFLAAAVRDNTRGAAAQRGQSRRGARGLQAMKEGRARFAVFLEFRNGRIVRQRNYDCSDPW